MRGSARCKSRRSAHRPITPRLGDDSPQETARRPRVISASPVSRTHGFGLLAAAIREGSTPLPESRTRASAGSRNKAKAALRTRLCSVPRVSVRIKVVPKAPVPSIPQDIGTQCPRPVDTAMPARFAFTPMPGQACTKRARSVRDHRRRVATAALERRSRPCPADRICWTSCACG